MPIDTRLRDIAQWVSVDLSLGPIELAPASADASFRRYFRVKRGRETYIVMDAPPGKEDLQPFLKVAALLSKVGVHVPEVLGCDATRGFLLLSDLGSRQYLDSLKAGREVDTLYADALAALARMQLAGRDQFGILPEYDRELLVREMALAPEWFLGRHLGLVLDANMRAMLDDLFELLVASALAQPQSFVHRDYHSRNLMICAERNPGILDFQDAVRGAVTYDLVSLFKDCYIAWPEARVRAWALQFRESLLQAGWAVARDDAEFLRWFDLMGLQRHIKVLGIFARLWYRDGKRGYLADLPLVLAYTRAAAERYAETADFARFLALRVEPAFAAAQARVLA
jgi:N-acetylmuramate 1-kinase